MPSFFKNIVYLLFPLLTVPTLAFNAKDVPAKSEGELLFYLDTSSFLARDRQTYQEFYYQLPFSELKFEEVAGTLTDSVLVKIEIQDTLHQVLVQDNWMIPIQAANWHELEGRFLPDQFEMTLVPGLYRLKMTITDSNSGKSGTAWRDFEAISFATEKLCTSQIQLASQILPDTTNSRFVKNSLNILPNPNRVFGRTLPVLYFYTEIYNLNSGAEEGKYSVSYQVKDFFGKIVRKFPPRIKPKRGARALEVGAVNLSTLEHATYFLEVGIIDLDSGDSIAVKRGFWHKLESILPPTVLAEENNATQAIKIMSEKERELLFRQLKYIIPSAQANLYQKLTPDAQVNFLINLWKDLDPEPATPENEFWDEFQERVRYANEQFTAAFQDGWRTDFGRILIRYGKPNDIVRRDIRGHAKPYQEWFYNREGGFRFIFIDEDGLGKYRLVFSSIETEYTDPNWKYLVGE